MTFSLQKRVLPKERAIVEGRRPNRPNNPVLWQRSFPFHNPVLFVIPSVPGFPTSQLSLATTYVVLLKENHMQLTEAATFDRKSGEAEGSAVRHSGASNLSFYNHFPFVILERS